MNIEKEKIKIPCPSCQNKIVINYHTESCYRCGMQFNPDYIHKIFHEYETRLLNNRAYQLGENLEKFGNATKDIGNGTSRIGCSLTLFITIPLLIILALLFF